jgi:serine/threonine protein kinase
MNKIFFNLKDELSVDLWSLGCVIAELYLGHPLFDGRSDIEQLGKIIDMMGPPELLWPEVKNLPFYMQFDSQNLKQISQVFIFFKGNN